MQAILWVVLCYLIGSVPFSYIFGRIMGGVDIRSKGSGNVGATNVLRNLGIKAGVLALIGDLLKGVIAAWIASVWGGPLLVLLCSAAALIGHCYPVFLQFKGGKAVATAGGIVLYLNPLIFLILAAGFALTVFISRYVSLGSLVAAALLPLVAIILHQNMEIIILYFFAAALVIYKHKENIGRLSQGAESKITFRINS